MRSDEPVDELCLRRLSRMLVEREKFPRFDFRLLEHSFKLSAILFLFFRNREPNFTCIGEKESTPRCRRLKKMSADFVGGRESKLPRELMKSQHKVAIEHVTATDNRMTFPLVHFQRAVQNIFPIPANDNRLELFAQSHQPLSEEFVIEFGVNRMC